MAKAKETAEKTGKPDKTMSLLAENDLNL